MSSGNERDHGLVVRPYILTGGRTEPSRRDLALETLVRATAYGDATRGLLAREQAKIVGLCRSFQSIAELTALLRLQIGVTRVLVSDLAETGHVRLYQPAVTSERPDIVLLRRVLHGLRSS